LTIGNNWFTLLLRAGTVPNLKKEEGAKKMKLQRLLNAVKKINASVERIEHVHPRDMHLPAKHREVSVKYKISLNGNIVDFKEGRNGEVDLVVARDPRTDAMNDLFFNKYYETISGVVEALKKVN
jgi:hypothetical protein